MTYLDYPILPLTGGIAYGATTQDGMPTPSTPAPLVNAIEAGAYRYARDGGNYQVTLPAMRGIGDVRDTWDAETGTFTQRVGELVLTGGVSATDGETHVSIMFEQISPTPSAYGAALCTHLPKAGNLTSFGFRPASKSIAFNMAGQSAYSDATTFVSWLAAQYAAGTPVIVYYQLATPVVSTITSELVREKLVTDRAQADYDEWKNLSEVPWSSMTAEQKAKWSVPMKGAYNYTDVNRVGSTMLWLQGIFASYGYNVAVDARADYMMGEWPTSAEMTAYIQSLKNLRRELAVAESTPMSPDSMDNGTVFIWNNIEQILLSVEDSLNRMVAHLDWLRSGEIYAGEGAFYEE